MRSACTDVTFGTVSGSGRMSNTSIGRNEATCATKPSILDPTSPVDYECGETFYVYMAPGTNIYRWSVTLSGLAPGEPPYFDVRLLNRAEEARV